MAVNLLGVPDWVEQGSAPMLGGSTVTDPGNPASGAVEDIAVDPSNPAHIFVATVNGGVWRTTNGNLPFNGIDDDGANGVDDALEQPTWTPLTDTFPSLSMGDIAFDPLDATGNTLYAGTGSTSSLGQTGGPAIGVMRTTNGGNTWNITRLNPSGAEPLTRSILPTTLDGNAALPGVQQVVMVGTTTGLFRSIDGGQSYTNISGTNGLGNGACTEIIVDPNNPSQFFASVVGQGVFRSIDGGANWTPVNTNLTNLAASTTIQLSAHAGGGTTVFHVLISGPNPVAFTSNNSGNTWNALAALPAGFTSSNNGLYTGMASDQLVSDPTNANVVYVAKGYGNAPFIYRYDPAGGGNWIQIESGGASGGTRPHVDSRELAFVNNVLLHGNDGGIYFMVNPQNAAANRWTSLHGRGSTGISATEYHNVAWDSTFNVIAGGAQDNGTTVQNSAGNFIWTTFSGGDGGDVQIDTVTAGAGRVFRYASSQNLAGLSRYTFDSATNQPVGAVGLLLPDPDANGPLTSTSLPNFNGPFVPPFELNAVAPARLVVGGGGTSPVYELTNANTAANAAGATWVAVPVGAGFGSVAGSFAAGGRLNGVNNPEVLVVGSGSNVFIRSTAGGTLTVTPAAFPGGNVQDIALDPNNWQHFFVVDSSGVWETTDAGNSWNDLRRTSTTGSLASVNTALQTVEFVSTGAGTVLVGGLFGTSRLSLADSTGPWTRYGNGLPNAPTFELDYSAVDDVLVAGTFGRGAWTIPNASVSINQTGILQIDGDMDFANEDDTIVLIRNAVNPQLLDVTVNGTAFGPFQISLIAQINVNGFGGRDNLIVDSSNGLIDVPSGIRYNGGIGFDRLTTQQTGGGRVSSRVNVGANPGDGQSVIDSQVINFENIEPIVDNVPAATFALSSVPGIATLLDASNAINYIPSQILFGGGRVTVDNFEPIEFINKSLLSIEAGAGNDVINLHNPLTPAGLLAIVVNGGDPTSDNDQVIANGTAGPDAINFTPLSGQNANIFGAGPVPIGLVSVEKAIVDDPLGTNSLTYTSPVGLVDLTYTPGSMLGLGTITASNGAELLMPITFKGINQNVQFVDTSPIADDQLTVQGTNQDDVMDLSLLGNVTIRTLTGAAVSPLINANGLPALFLDGLSGNDHFSVDGSHPFGRVTVIGSESDNGVFDSSDSLVFDGAGASIQNNSTLLGFSELVETGFGPVSFNGIENVVINAAGSALTASLGEDSIIYTPSGTASGTYQAEELNPVYQFFDVNGTFTVNGTTDVADILTVEATNGRDQITVDAPARIVTVNNAAGTTLKPVTLSDNLETVSVNGRNGNDTFLVVPAPTSGAIPGNNLQVNIDGGLPGASDALVISTAAGATLPATDFVVNSVGLLPGQGRIRVYRNATAMPDISYNNVEIVSPKVVVTNGAPQLLVLGPDASEPNEYRTTATHLGSGQSINVDNLAIFPDSAEHPGVPADVDFFQVLAKDTGILDVAAMFQIYSATLLPGGGQLGLRILDASGNVIGGGGTFGSPNGLANARARVPVVAGQVYYVTAFGETALGVVDPTVVNGYSLTLTNVVPPVPQAIELLDNPTGDPPPANSDTGRSQTDNITRDNTPTLVFRLDDALLLNDLPGNDAPSTPVNQVIPIPFQAAAGAAGYRIAIFDEGSSPAPGTQAGSPPQTPLGFATFVAPGVYQFTAPALSDGSHFLTARVHMVDPATPQQTGFGARSEALEVVVDTKPPVTFFGNPISLTDGLLKDSDTGIPTVLGSIVDRITNDVTPTMYGSAEADSIIRLFVDKTNNGFTADDILLGQAIARPVDGTDQSLGEWEITATTSLNSPELVAALGIVKDGVRHLFVTAEDVAGNVSAPAALDILIDTESPRVSAVNYPNGTTVFATKPNLAPSPPTTSLLVTYTGGPASAGGFTLNAADDGQATNVGNYRLVGDHTGVILVANVALMGSNAGATTVRLNFTSPLPDDRYTLTILDTVSDVTGNLLDGDSQASAPAGAAAILPSGNGLPGGNFVGRFTIDSRPELGVVGQGLVYVDINGNAEWDPTGNDNDATNRDFVFQFGTVTDGHFAGNFAQVGAAAASGFDKLGVYGKVGPTYSFLIDTNDDGVGDVSTISAYQVNAIPVAGNFNAAHPGDEIGMFDGQYWYLDNNGNNTIDANERFLSNFTGIPIVGDFNGDLSDDLATYRNDTNTFYFDLDRNGTVDKTWEVRDTVKRFGGLAGFTDRPLAGDINLDGVDDIGLWTKSNGATLPANSGEAFFWVSDRKAADPAQVFDAYSPAPLGNDLFMQFGNENALPVFGNFDPPVADVVIPTPTENYLHRASKPLDVNGDNVVSPMDALMVINAINSHWETAVANPARAAATFGNSKVDTSGDAILSAMDALLVINALNQASASGEGESDSSISASSEPGNRTSAADYFFADLEETLSTKKRR